MNDTDYMRLALELARRGEGWTNPNPMVGAVLVRDGRILSTGYHERCGALHAERHALSRCTESPAGATLYVTLEPCCHHGRQPPCTDAIIESGIARVVVGSDDPNPLVAGKGLEILRQAGIQVETGVLKAECDALNRIFFHYIQTGRPYVILKYAMTADGKIATRTGASQWITGEAARRHVHTQRNRYRAIMVGVGTVLADDPQLTCRLKGGRDPLRVICDTNLRTPLTANVVRTAQQTPTCIATCVTQESRLAPYRQAGCQVLSLPQSDGHVSLRVLLDHLGKQNVDSVLAEGGSAIHWSLVQGGLVDRVQAYLAPKILGGTQAKSPVGGQGFPHPDQALKLKTPVLTRLGEDILWESEVER